MKQDIEHTTDCITARAKYALVEMKYKLKWPKHCKTCNGWGGTTSYYDPSPPGISLSSGQMQEFDACPDCIEKDRCPRCGMYGLIAIEENEYFDNLTCKHCGFELDHSEGLPEEPECFCWDHKLTLDMELDDLMDRAMP